MCGIVGGVSYQDKFVFDKLLLSSASDYLKYRGPDSAGEQFFKSGNACVSLGHRRLSIIDLTADANQPMTSFSGRTTIVFNGEIYNYREVREELVQSGAQFKTHSDTEVILNAVETWGIRRALTRLDGMFAFGLFDRRTNVVHLARDRFGKKPLYYSDDLKQIAFSSDIRSLELIMPGRLEIDLHSLGYYFAELSTPLEGTVWRQIKKMKPASFLTFSEKGVEEYDLYWKLQYTESCTMHQADIVERTNILLENAVKKRLVADVKVSALLSGGIDSSLMVAKMSELSSTPVKTYSVGFREATFNELPYARYVADKFKTDHTEIMLDPTSIVDHRALIREFGEPFADSSMIPTYLISKEISRNEKVVLGGDGGDELFAGYSSYYFAYKFDKFKNLAALAPLVQFINKYVRGYRINFLNDLLQQTRQPRHHLLDRDFGFKRADLPQLLNEPEFYEALDKEHQFVWDKYGGTSSTNLIRVLSASLSTRLVNDYLVKVDRASMCASLEMRSPFLDKDLAEFAATLNADQLFQGAGPKTILKSIASQYFDPSFVHRKKMGFGVPVGHWFKDVLRDEVRSVILDGRQSLVNLNYKFIEQIIDQHNSGFRDHTHRLWALYVFHIWANRK